MSESKKIKIERGWEETRGWYLVEIPFDHPAGFVPADGSDITIKGIAFWTGEKFVTFFAGDMPDGELAYWEEQIFDIKTAKKLNISEMSLDKNEEV